MGRGRRLELDARDKVKGRGRRGWKDSMKNYVLMTICDKFPVITVFTEYLPYFCIQNVKHKLLSLVS